MTKNNLYRFLVITVACFLLAVNCFVEGKVVSVLKFETQEKRIGVG